MKWFKWLSRKLLFIFVAITVTSHAQTPSAAKNEASKVNAEQAGCDAGFHRVSTSFGSYCGPDNKADSVPASEIGGRFADCKKIASAVTLRGRPDGQSPIIASIPCGTKVQLVGEQNGWDEVRTSAGILGYVSFVMLSEKPVSNSEGTAPPEGSDNAMSEAYAIRATVMLRDVMKDPTSFTLVQAIVCVQKTRKRSEKENSFSRLHSLHCREQLWRQDAGLGWLQRR
jgi:Bacterial SH3 domain